MARTICARSFSAICVIACVLSSVGCGHSAVAPPRTQPAQASEREKVGVIVTTSEAIPISELLVRAEQRLGAGEFSLAAIDFQLLLAARHETALESRIRLGCARSLEGTGQLELAADQLELRVPLAQEDARDSARLEWMRSLLLLERVEAASAVAKEIDSARVGVEGRMIVRVANALALLSAGDASGADAALAPAWVTLEAAGQPLGSSLELSAAWLSFAAGEVETFRARKIGFDPVPDDVHAVLESRCRHMVAAQSAYAEAMRLGQPRVESGRLRLLSGERIASLYLELHRDILAAPLPSDSTGGRERAALADDQEALAQGALLLRYEVLLEKAEQMLRITLSGTPDSSAARPVRVRLERTLAQVVTQRAASAATVDGLPVPRADLARILESIGAPPTAPQAGQDEPSRAGGIPPRPM